MSRKETYTSGDDDSSTSEEEPMETTEVLTEEDRPNQKTIFKVPDTPSVEESIANTRRKLLEHEEMLSQKQKNKSAKEWALLTTRDYSRCFTEIVAKVHADLLSGRIKMAGVAVTDRNALKCNKKIRWDKNVDRERMSRSFSDRMKKFAQQRCDCWQCVIRCEKERAKARARLLPKPLSKNRCVLTEALFSSVDHAQTPCEDAALADLRRQTLIAENFKIIRNLCQQRNVSYNSHSTQTERRRVTKVNESTQTDLEQDVGIQKGANLTRIRRSQDSVYISEGTQVCMPEPPHQAKPVAKVVGQRHRFYR